MWFHGRRRPQVSKFKAAERTMSAAARESVRADRAVAKLRERLDKLDRGIPAASEIDDSAAITIESSKFLALLGLDIAIIGSATAYLAQCAFPGNPDAAHLARFIVPIFVLLFEIFLNDKIFCGGGTASTAVAAGSGVFVVGILVALTVASALESADVQAVGPQGHTAIEASGDDPFESPAPTRQNQPEKTGPSLARQILGWAQAALVGIIHLVVVFDNGARVAYRRLLRRLLRRPVASSMQRAEADAARAREALAVALEDYHAEFQTKPVDEQPGPWGMDVVRAVNAIYGRVTLSPAEPASVGVGSSVPASIDDEAGPSLVARITERQTPMPIPGRNIDDDGEVRTPFSREQ
jgi:hypothetical protein